MTAQEFRSARQRAQMSIKQCADYLGNAPRSVRRYEDGTRAIPGPVAKLMTMLVMNCRAGVVDDIRAGLHEGEG